MRASASPSSIRGLDAILGDVSANLDLVRSICAKCELGDYGSANRAGPNIEFVCRRKLERSERDGEGVARLHDPLARRARRCLSGTYVAARAVANHRCGPLLCGVVRAAGPGC